MAAVEVLFFTRPGLLIAPGRVVGCAKKQLTEHFVAGAHRQQLAQSPRLFARSVLHSRLVDKHIVKYR